MKIIIFFVLAGLSLAQDDLNCPEPPTPKENKECMIETLQKLSDSTKELKTFICHYQGTLEDNQDNYDASMKELTRTMACAGCDANKLLGIKNATFEEILKDTGKLGDKGGELALKVTDALGLSEGATKLLCDGVGDVLAAECKEKLLTEEAPKLMEDLKVLYCKHDQSKVTGEDTAEILVEMGCIGDKSLHTKETLTKLFTDVGDDLEPTLDDVLDTAKEITVEQELLGDLLCSASEIVLGEKPLVDAGGGDGIVGSLLGAAGGDGGAGGVLGSLSG